MFVFRVLNLAVFLIFDIYFSGFITDPTPRFFKYSAKFALEEERKLHQMQIVGKAFLQLFLTFIYI